MKTGIVVNKKLGFVSIDIFGFMLLIVWGFCGNCYYGKRATLRFDFGRIGVWDCIITVRGKSFLETMFYLSHKRWPHWNSEHIALKFGKCHGDDGMNPSIPIHNVYKGILGYHIYL